MKNQLTHVNLIFLYFPAEIFQLGLIPGANLHGNRGTWTECSLRTNYETRLRSSRPDVFLPWVLLVSLIKH